MSLIHFDLVVLVPDKNMEAAIRGLLSRPQSLGVRPIEFDIYVHPARDPGCLLSSHEFLRTLMHRYSHAMVLFDHSGCGKEDQSTEALEETVKARLAANGWNVRAEVIVLDPELEVWVWSGSRQVDLCFGWKGSQGNLRMWLQNRGLWKEQAHKPQDPKGSMEEVLRHLRKPRSSSLYEKLARNVSLERCQDMSFYRFRKILQAWFGE
jgi:hypothetical protein